MIRTFDSIKLKISSNHYFYFLLNHKLTYGADTWFKVCSFTITNDRCLFFRKFIYERNIILNLTNRADILLNSLHHILVNR